MAPFDPPRNPRRHHERASDVIDRVLGSFVAGRLLQHDDVDDVRSTVMLRVLQRFEDSQAAARLQSFEDYVARMTINAANDLLRARRSAAVPLTDRQGGNAVDSAPASADAVATREMLELLWNVIGELPLLQRRALLFYAHDSGGGSVIPLLVFTGVATLEEIGAVVEYDPLALEGLWDRLPLPDLQIAELLGLTRPQVIGLRRAARERLDRARQRLGLPRPLTKHDGRRK
jgi:DNA-directed RNA polymerase specialized sigma24 family protein